MVKSGCDGARVRRRSNADMALKRFRKHLKSPGVRHQLLAHGQQLKIAGKRKRRRKLRRIGAARGAFQQNDSGCNIKGSVFTLESAATKVKIERMKNCQPVVNTDDRRESRLRTLGIVTSKTVGTDDDDSSSSEEEVLPEPAPIGVGRQLESVMASDSSEGFSSQSSITSSPVEDVIEMDNQTVDKSPFKLTYSVESTPQPITALQEAAEFLTNSLDTKKLSETLPRTWTMSMHSAYLRSLYYTSNSHTRNGGNKSERTHSNSVNQSPYNCDFVTSEPATDTRESETIRSNSMERRENHAHSSNHSRMWGFVNKEPTINTRENETIEGRWIRTTHSPFWRDSPSYDATTTIRNKTREDAFGRSLRRTDVDHASSSSRMSIHVEGSNLSEEWLDLRTELNQANLLAGQNATVFPDHTHRAKYAKTRPTDISIPAEEVNHRDFALESTDATEVDFGLFKRCEKSGGGNCNFARDYHQCDNSHGDVDCNNESFAYIANASSPQAYMHTKPQSVKTRGQERREDANSRLVMADFTPTDERGFHCINSIQALSGLDFDQTSSSNWFGCSDVMT